MKKIAMIGTGAYGLGVSIALLKKNESITMWVENEEKAKLLNNNKKNANILPNIEIPETIIFTNDLNEVIKKIFNNDNLNIESNPDIYILKNDDSIISKDDIKNLLEEISTKSQSNKSVTNVYRQSTYKNKKILCSISE